VTEVFTEVTKGQDRRAHAGVARKGDRDARFFREWTGSDRDREGQCQARPGQIAAELAVALRIDSLVINARTSKPIGDEASWRRGG
jgi:hypothetical protein